MRKRRLIVPIALLAASAPVAVMAQTNGVTMFGRVDLGVAKNIGSDAKGIQNGSPSRLGFRGTEDLGGGLRAFFNFEHRFNADTGAQSATRFWHARSIIGLQGAFGQLSLGRDVTSAYAEAQVGQDPFGHVTIASMLRFGSGDIAPIRNDNAIRYVYAGGGFTARAEIAEAKGNDGLNDFAERPKAFGVSYRIGNFYAAVGRDDPGGVNDVWDSATVHYKVGNALLRLGLGNGKTNADRPRRSYMLAATLPVGERGQFHVAHGRLDDGSPDVKLSEKTAAGYYYNLSKQVFLYANVANDRAAASSKLGYDLGISHSF